MERFRDFKNTDILIIAGEASGDEHAAVLVQKLRQKNPSLKIAALGGRKLAEADAFMLEDLVAHSRVGIWEVFKHLPQFLKLISETILWIEKNRPKMVLFVDFVGYNLEIAKRLYQKKISHKACGPTLLYFYVSPQIWAWKSGRRFKIAQWIDSLGTIFPFEPSYYKDTDLCVEFVGHPSADEGYQNAFSYDPQGPVLLLPGSRRAIVSHHLPLLWQAFLQYERAHPGTKAISCYASEPLRQQMISLTGGKLPLYPAGAPIKASAVVCTIGTVALTVALAGIPCAVFYKTDPLTYFYGKSVYRQKFLGMPNILLDRLLVKELVQSQVSAGSLAAEINRLKEDPQAAAEAAEGAEALRRILQAPKERTVAEWVEGGLSQQS